MKVVILHNPRCSKSRATLELLTSQGLSPEIFEYLKTPPTKKWLNNVLKLLDLKPRELMRKNESEYKTLNLADPKMSDAQLIEAMINHPKLIERPIVVIDDKKAAIGRPPENVLSVL